MNRNNKKTFLANFIATTVIGVIFLGLSLLGVFEKLDYRLYDSVLKLKNDPVLADNIAVITINDEDIEKFGEWPWTRDILADTLIYLKELEAESAVFDIEYISPSKLSVGRNSLEVINDGVNVTYAETQRICYDILSRSINGITADNIEKIENELIGDGLNKHFTDLSDIVSDNFNIDNDEYFAKAIQFFGNTILTTNNLKLGYKIAPEYMEYIKNRLLKLEVEDEKNLIKKNNEYTFTHTYNGSEKKGFTPALEILMKCAEDFGFTNSDIDTDGTRRRIELIYEIDGNYYASLAFAPLLKYFNTNKLVRKNNVLIIKDCVLDDQLIDIKIPLDENGRLLINYQHETSKSNVIIKNNDSIEDDDLRMEFGFPTRGVQEINSLGILEDNVKFYISELLKYVVFDEEGFPLDYWQNISNLNNSIIQIDEMKKNMLDKCTGYDENGNPVDGISDDEYKLYFTLKDELYDNLSLFVNDDSVGYIRSVLIDPEYYDDDLINFCNQYEDLFNGLKNDALEFIARKNQLKNKLKNKICFIGMTAASTTDLGATPFNKQYANVFIHSNVLNTIITKQFITYYPWFVAYIFVMIIMYLLCLLSFYSSTVQNIIGGVVRVAIILIFIFMLKFTNIYIPFVSSAIFLSLSLYIEGLIYRYTQSSKGRKLMKDVASAFANKDTVEILSNHPELLTTTGQKKNIIALFSDVQKFSTLSECIEQQYGEEAPMVLCDILNRYLGDMSIKILKNDGQIDKYEGDAIVAMFGAPIDEAHTLNQWAFLSLDAAVKMKKSEIIFNNSNPDLFVPRKSLKTGEMVQLKPLQTRIGLNIGSAYVGNMGADTKELKKLNFTMMGDTVNLASRLEETNKEYKTWIMCSEDTWIHADSEENKGKIVARKLDRIRVVGKNIPVTVYEICGYTEDISDDRKIILKEYENALELYFNRQFKEAYEIFKKNAETDYPSEIFMKRSMTNIENGVPENWDGVYTRTVK